MARRRQPELRVLGLDSEVVVVDKPAGVVSVPGRGGEVSLPELLRARPDFAPDEPLRVVHRLDMDATGVIVYARTLAAQRALVRQFAERRVEKVYLALVRGYVESDGEVSLCLYYDKRAGHMRASPCRGKPSCTRYSVRQRVPGHTLLECQPLTGRTHQIRAHLAAIGFPLAVDHVYGGARAVLLSEYKPDYRPSTRHAERPLIQRLTLHAARLSFTHPADGERVTFEAALPKDLRVTLNQLARLA
ncbi:MAG: RluA family pseudouridine synthase [Planctomycetes bacterium]|nr:RluA family pseudouridine synthase [Planctomycetota bacterium]